MMSSVFGRLRNKSYLTSADGERQLRTGRFMPRVIALFGLAGSICFLVAGVRILEERERLTQRFYDHLFERGTSWWAADLAMKPGSCIGFVKLAFQERETPRLQAQATFNTTISDRSTLVKLLLDAGFDQGNTMSSLLARAELDSASLELASVTDNPKLLQLTVRSRFMERQFYLDHSDPVILIAHRDRRYSLRLPLRLQRLRHQLTSAIPTPTDLFGVMFREIREKDLPRCQQQIESNRSIARGLDMTKVIPMLGGLRQRGIVVDSGVFNYDSLN